MTDTLHTAIDSLSAVKENTSDNWIMHHILDGSALEFDPFGAIHLPEINLFGFDLSITKYVVYMFFVAIVLVLILSSAAKSYSKSRVPKGFSRVIEILVIFVRDDIAKPTIGKGHEKFLPYLLTVFFFILLCNFVGLVPYGATATSNISVTATLSIFTFVAIQAGGIAKNGFFGYFKGLIPHGVPGWLLPIMFVVEILGLLTKPFALTIRLFANLTAGHIVLLSLIGLIFISWMFIPVAIGFTLFIYLLEILVSIIQAYIFTMLSSLFIGMAVHQDH